MEEGTKGVSHFPWKKRKNSQSFLLKDVFAFAYREKSRIFYPIRFCSNLEDDSSGEHGTRKLETSQT